MKNFTLTLVVITVLIAAVVTWFALKSDSNEAAQSETPQESSQAETVEALPVNQEPPEGAAENDDDDSPVIEPEEPAEEAEEEMTDNSSEGGQKLDNAPAP